MKKIFLLFFLSLAAHAEIYSYNLNGAVTGPFQNNVISNLSLGSLSPCTNGQFIGTVGGVQTCVSSGAVSLGVSSINSDISAAQTLVVGTSGTDFAIVDGGSGVHTFNLPTASASNRGALKSADWSTFNGKQAALTLGNLTSPTTGISISGGTGAVVGSGAAVSIQTASGSQPGLLAAADWTTFNSKQSSIATGTTSQFLLGNGSLATLSTSSLPEGSNLYYTNARVNTQVAAITTVTHQGDVFNGNSQLLQLNSSGQIPAVDGHLITGLNNYSSYTVSTTNNSATTLFTQALSTGSYTCQAVVSAFRTDSQDTGHWQVMGSVYLNGGACVFEDSTRLYEKRSDANFTVAFACSSSNVILQVTGNTGKSIDWKGYVLCDTVN